ncbi:hypothetical protein PIROE2DRAFT_14478 [Piromyces sp. E2]|nr:hypothetical protein PIROE2DRAFT_14478 [Piromyces sp. E2]|eukprot:OUM59890.1 hypothetical protein PIROE2DRAFT_14478 [Piromyces sp. E2]
MVNFGNKVNICQFSDTPLTCYQANTCGFIFGYTKYRNCYDSEIEQVHVVDIKNTKFPEKNEKKSNPVLKYIFIGGICLGVLILLTIVALLYQKKYKKSKDDDIVISPTNNVNSSYEEKSDNSLSREHLINKNNTIQSIQSNKSTGKRVTINVPPSPPKAYQTNPYSTSVPIVNNGTINHNHSLSHNVVPLNQPIIINNVQTYTNNYPVYSNNLQAYTTNNIPVVVSPSSTIPSILRGSSSSSLGSSSNITTTNNNHRNYENINHGSSLRVSESSTNKSNNRRSSKTITFTDE